MDYVTKKKRNDPAEVMPQAHQMRSKELSEQEGMSAELLRQRFEDASNQTEQQEE